MGSGHSGLGNLEERKVGLVELLNERRLLVRRGVVRIGQPDHLRSRLPYSES